MSLQQVRFLHSSDWRLEVPIGGVVEVPSALRDPFLDAPYQAAERVVQAAIDEQVDFLLLSGNTLSIETACPYSFEFLLRQFQRLADQGINVYWLGGQLDDLDLWPAQLDLPKNVKTFPVGSLQELRHKRDGKQVATLVGQSWRRGATWRASDYASSEDTIPRIAACFGSVQKRSLTHKGVAYWAIGGHDRHQVLAQDGTTAAFAGSPQGRCPEDVDAHGAVLVELGFGKADTRLIETDVWRWRREEVSASELTSVEQLQKRLVQQLTQKSSDSSRCGTLLALFVTCHGTLATQLQSPERSVQLLRALQTATQNESRWPLAVDVEPAELPVELAEEDTILGDFLRSVRRYEQESDAWQELLAYLPEDESRESITALLQNGTESSRQLLWRSVAAWGADLLRGDATVNTAS